MHGLLFRGIRTRGAAAAIATVLALGIGTASVSANTFSLDLVYLGGHTVVPGEIETFNGPAISWASLNNFRQVSSLGSWTPAGQQFGELGMFKWEAGVLYDLMKDTDVTNAPGFASPPSGVQNGLISDTGNVAFRFGINGEDAIAKGPTRAGLTTIAVSGGANAPGNASPFLFLGSPQHNGTRLAFYGRSSGDIGIWTGNETNGVVYRFAQEDQTLLPGTASVIDDMIFREPVINTSGFTAAEVGWDGGKSAIIAGNPAKDRDWWETKNRFTGKLYRLTTAHWAATEARFRRHFKQVKDAAGLVPLEEFLWRITQDDVVHRRFLVPGHRSFVPDFGVYIEVEDAEEKVKTLTLSRQMVLFCVERRKAWRLLQSRAGVANLDYVAQKAVLSKVDKGEITLDAFLKRAGELVAAARPAPAKV